MGLNHNSLARYSLHYREPLNLKRINVLVKTIDVKSVFYVFYYFFKNAFLRFLFLERFFYFLVATTFNPTKPIKVLYKTTFVNCKYDDLYSTVSSKLLLGCCTRLLNIKAKVKYQI